MRHENIISTLVDIIFSKIIFYLSAEDLEFFHVYISGGENAKIPLS